MRVAYEPYNALKEPLRPLPSPCKQPYFSESSLILSDSWLESLCYCSKKSSKSHLKVILIVSSDLGLCGSAWILTLVLKYPSYTKTSRKSEMCTALRRERHSGKASFRNVHCAEARARFLLCLNQHNYSMIWKYAQRWGESTIFVQE